MQSHKSQPPDRFEFMFTPYGLTLDLEDHFTHKFREEQFYDIVETIATGHTKNSQIKIFELFKKLTINEVIRRSQIVSRLSKVLLDIQIKSKGSNDISCPFTKSTKQVR